MTPPDLNLLVTLNVLLEEGSVARAARRLRLSPSAMSRALARLREVTGDPLLVRAGRGLVRSPRAEEMREEVARLVSDAHALLRSAERLDLARLKRCFTIRTSDGFAETFGPELMRIVSSEAPGVSLRFARKLDKDSTGLREGSVDLETGVVDKTIGPEIRAQALFGDRYVVAVRAGHPLVEDGITPESYTTGAHVVIARRSMETEPVERALAAQGIARRIAVTVDGFSAALAFALTSDLIATVPERHTQGLRAGMVTLDPPFAAEGFTVSLLWHPRMDGDAAHRWMRDCMRRACARTTLPQSH